MLDRQRVVLGVTLERGRTVMFVEHAREKLSVLNLGGVDLHRAPRARVQLLRRTRPCTHHQTTAKARLPPDNMAPHAPCTMVSPQLVEMLLLPEHRQNTLDACKRLGRYLRGNPRYINHYRWCSSTMKTCLSSSTFSAMLT